MKNTKLSRIILLALSVAVLVGCALAFSVSAAEEENDGIVLKNLYYDEKVAILFAVDATVGQAENGDVTVEYYWDDATDDVKQATYYPDDGTLGTDYPVFITEGLAAKELGKLAHVTFTDASGAKHEETYSVAEYLYKRLYVDGFAAKTEADGIDYNRKLLYQNLLNYGEQAQLVFDYEIDKLLNDYSIAYTTSELINLAGKSYVFGHGAISVEGTVIGEGTIAGWTVTDLVNGGSSESENVVLSLTGAYQVEPIFGVHEHIDENNDHICDNCPEKISDCTTTDGDHICDLCGKIATKCADGNADGKCDTCGAYTFSVDKINSSNMVDIYNVTMKDTSNVDERDYVDNSTDRTYTKAAFLSLALADPTDAANQVLKINSVTVSSAKLSTITFTPEELVAGGDVYVIEADLTMLGDFTNNGRPAIEFFMENNDDTATKNVTALYTGAKVDGYVSAFRLANAADTDAAKFNPGEWGKAMLVCKGGTYKTYYSKDGGLTWVYAASNTYSIEIAQLGFRFNVYNCNGTTLIDNVKCYKTNSVKLNIGGTVTDVFPES
ncbi:MAG: hypothetical protein J6B48_05700 [Clostridia bacterium]|nr:hypothetical protein [Clostridia bacterium]